MKPITELDGARPADWEVVNDVVMGGRSTGEMRLTDGGTARFTGYVSLENDGGFASTRLDVEELDLSACDGAAVRVRGDGRRYQLRFRSGGNDGRHAYRCEFDTVPGEWTEIRLPFTAFEPSFRGRVPPGADPLDPSRIRQVGFLIADGKQGPFRLEIAWVRAYAAD